MVQFKSQVSRRAENAREIIKEGGSRDRTSEEKEGQIYQREKKRASRDKQASKSINCSSRRVVGGSWEKGK